MLRFRKKREGGNEMTPIDAEAVQLVLVDSMLPKNTGRMIEKGLSSPERQQGIYFVEDLEQIKEILQKLF